MDNDWYPDLKQAMKLCEMVVLGFDAAGRAIKGTDHAEALAFVKAQRDRMAQIYDCLANIEGKSHFGLSPDGY